MLFLGHNLVEFILYTVQNCCRFKETVHEDFRRRPSLENPSPNWRPWILFTFIENIVLSVQSITQSLIL